MNKNILITVITFIVAATSFIGCDREYDIPPIATLNQDKILNISDIYQIYADNGNNYTFNESYMFYATVTMDDDSNNIYKEAYVQDSTGGINLYRLSAAGATNEGDYVRINLNGASIVDYAGKLELVFSNVSDFRKQIVVIKAKNPVKPPEVSLEDVFTGKYNCQLVKLKGVQFTANNLTLNYGINSDSGYTNREIENCNNLKVTVRTSNLADFAQEKVAQGNGDIVGIITKFNDTWQLIIRSLDEVNMDGDRCSGTK